MVFMVEGVGDDTLFGHTMVDSREVGKIYRCLQLNQLSSPAVRPCVFL